MYLVSAGLSSWHVKHLISPAKCFKLVFMKLCLCDICIKFVFMPRKKKNNKKIGCSKKFMLNLLTWYKIINRGSRPKKKRKINRKLICYRNSF